MRGLWVAVILLLWGCASPGARATTAGTKGGVPTEPRLRNLRQFTFEGENAEAYWSFGGDKLLFQGHAAHACEQVYLLDLNTPKPEPRRVSTGYGAAKYGYFLPGDQRVIYASTHLADRACPAELEHSQGSVWPIHSSFDIFSANLDGTALVRLTDTPGYDAEGRVCAKDGSIVFTSARDGDLELYRMDSDGHNVVRLTHEPGYDGGASFNADCSKLVWRASRPKGQALQDYRTLLAQGLVRHSKLELLVADADGSNPAQITYLGAEALAPFFHPDGKRVLFSSNFQDPRGREFDIWSVNIDGSGLERVTSKPGFDGSPVFSGNGKYLAFASDRETPPDSQDTHLFVADWIEDMSLPASVVVSEASPDRVMRDIAWLSAPERQGRGLGTAGLDSAGRFVAQRLAELGLEPIGPEFELPFEVTTAVERLPATKLDLVGLRVSDAQFSPLSFSSVGEVDGELALAGYGISEPALGHDDYENVDVAGKIALVRRFVPDTELFQEESNKRRFGDLRYKAWQAREHGAKAVLVVDAPVPSPGQESGLELPPEAPFPGLTRNEYGDAGILAAIASRAATKTAFDRLARGLFVKATLSVAVRPQRAKSFNVAGRLSATQPSKLPPIVVGAHYDHLGYGGPNSLQPDSREAHLGADDNASGTAAMLEVARLAAARSARRRDILFIAFSAEESGLLGSSALVAEPPSGLDISGLLAMINLDMVGRLRNNELTILGSQTASEWPELIDAACTKRSVSCAATGGGYGPSDQTPFYTAGVPVLHLFTGAHDDYHKPSDSVDKINGAGVARIAEVVQSLLEELEQVTALTYQKVDADKPIGDVRSFNASLGSIPDYAGPKTGVGVLLAGVRTDGAAQRAGMRRGDILRRLGTRDITSVHDLMYALQSFKPGETVRALVLRDGQPLTLTVTFQEQASRR